LTSYFTEAGFTFDLGQKPEPSSPQSGTVELRVYFLNETGAYNNKVRLFSSTFPDRTTSLGIFGAPSVIYCYYSYCTIKQEYKIFS
jgi:hypothetical protein